MKLRTYQVKKWKLSCQTQAILLQPWTWHRLPRGWCTGRRLVVLRSCLLCQADQYLRGLCLRWFYCFFPPPFCIHYAWWCWAVCAAKLCLRWFYFIFYFFFLLFLRPRSISSSLSHHQQSSLVQSLPFHFFLLSLLIHHYKFFLIFLPLVVISLSTLTSYSLPSIQSRPNHFNCYIFNLPSICEGWGLSHGKYFLPHI